MGDSRPGQFCQFKTLKFLTAENSKSTKNVGVRDCHSSFFAIFAIFVVKLPVLAVPAVLGVGCLHEGERAGEKMILTTDYTDDHG